MKIFFEKSFGKDLEKLSDKKIAKRLLKTIEDLETSSDLKEFSIKKLKGYTSYYRLKIGEYRLGFVLEDSQVNLVRFLHRREIYRFFP